MPKRNPILKGTKFGRLTVIGEPYKVKHWYQVFCKCQCGKIKGIIESSLRNGDTRSCGCLWSETVPGKVNVKAKGEANFNQLFSNYRNKALKNNLQFALTKIDFKSITVMNCHYCGKSPSQIINVKQSNGVCIYNGIDRKDNNLGYTNENCVPCCRDCNTLKRNISYPEFIEYFKRIYNYWAKPYIGITACIEIPEYGIEVYSESNMRGVRS